ncbi:MAG: hypothetical protein OEY13_11870 [Gammaproteobacteria bacterium]|nr:hypothetical protein [Gammaproteobacteria bacterium]MDH5273762.1 hypothetical protein [Gammaproteobacteria bacterium]
MAIASGGGPLDRGHPVTCFVDDRGVLIGSATKASDSATQQRLVRRRSGTAATGSRGLELLDRLKQNQRFRVDFWLENELRVALK